MVGKIVLAQPYASVVGRDQTGDHVEARRLASAVGAEQADDLTLVEAQGHAVDNVTAPIAFDQVFCCQLGHDSVGDRADAGANNNVGIFTDKA